MSKQSIDVINKHLDARFGKGVVKASKRSDHIHFTGEHEIPSLYLSGDVDDIITSDVLAHCQQAVSAVTGAADAAAQERSYEAARRFTTALVDLCREWDSEMMDIPEYPKYLPDLTQVMTDMQTWFSSLPDPKEKL